MDLVRLVRRGANRARQGRMAMLQDRFPDLDQMHVIDMGGDPAVWEGIPTGHITLVNIIDYPAQQGISTVAADACTWEGTGDLVYSNSLLEHLGGHWRRMRFAENVRRTAPHHWVQTPNRYFPVEPHWLCPGMQYVPVDWRVDISLRWRFGYMKTLTRHDALREVLDVELIGKTEMEYLFPGSDVVVERWAGLAKSLIAVTPPGGIR